MINKEYVGELVDKQLKALNESMTHPLEALQLISDLEKDLAILLDKFVQAHKELSADAKELFDTAATYIFTKSCILNMANESLIENINTPPTYIGAIQ
jgi:hypothetical protein